MKEKGVTFVREPKEEEYGTVAVFEDLYGNKWNLLEPKVKIVYVTFNQKKESNLLMRKVILQPLFDVRHQLCKK